jgi:Tol biopolymer transport system component
MHAAFRLIVGAAVLAFCGCPLGTPQDHYRPPGQADTTIAVSPAGDTILFNAAVAGGRDLYLLRLSDLSVTRIAETPEYEVAPSFSPDGQRIVYAAGVPGDRADHLFTIGIDGSSKSQLTDIDANDTSPRFSPDGTMIVFARDKTYTWGGLAANWEPGGVICAIGTDGSGERQLTSDDVFAFAPAFSHNGNSVIYFTLEGCFSVALDGSGVPQQIGPMVSYASLSPDGKQFVFAEGQYSPDFELFIANIDGTDKSQITASSRGCFHPVFAQSGDRVFFLVQEWPQGPSGEPKSSLWTVKVDGTDQRQVADFSLFDAPDVWKSQVTH